MNAADIINAEQAAERAIRAVKNLPVSNEFNSSLATALDLLSEVRHFASCWHDNVENLRSGAITQAQYDSISAKLEERLLSFCKPRV